MTPSRAIVDPTSILSAPIQLDDIPANRPIETPQAKPHSSHPTMQPMAHPYEVASVQFVDIERKDVTFNRWIIKDSLSA